MKKSPPDLGKTLQSLRKDQRLTLDKLAEMSGVSKSMLSQIERGQTNPTFATLWNLTNALGVDITHILKNSSDTSQSPALIEHLQDHFTPTIQSPDGKCSLKILSPVSSVAQMEWYDFKLSGGGCLQSAAHAKGTVEHLTCQIGRLDVTAGEESFTLTDGETVRYRADLPHTITNPTNENAQAILVVASAD